MPARAPSRAVQRHAGTSRPTTPRSGGYTFAERPEAEAPEARIIWHADLDPGTLQVIALPAAPADPDSIDPSALAPWLSVVTDRFGEHVVLSDGWRHIRLDLEQGSLLGGRVVLHYRLRGVASAERRVLPLRRFIHLCRHRHFGESLYPRDKRIERWLAALRVHDGLMAGASQSEIAQILYDRVRSGVTGDRLADSLRSRVRRLAREAGQLAAGGYRALLRR